MKFYSEGCAVHLMFHEQHCSGLSHIFLNTSSHLLSMGSYHSQAFFCTMYHRAQFSSLCCSPCIPSPWPLSSVQMTFHTTFTQMIMNCMLYVLQPSWVNFLIGFLLACLMSKAGQFKTNLNSVSIRLRQWCLASHQFWLESVYMPLMLRVERVRCPQV